MFGISRNWNYLVGFGLIILIDITVAIFLSPILSQQAILTVLSISMALSVLLFILWLRFFIMENQNYVQKYREETEQLKAEIPLIDEKLEEIVEEIKADSEKQTYDNPDLMKQKVINVEGLEKQHEDLIKRKDEIESRVKRFS